MHTSEARTGKARTRARKPASSHLLKVAMMLLLPVLVAAIVACDSAGSTSNTGSGQSAVTVPTNSPQAAAPSSAPYANSPEGKPKGLSAPIPDPKEVLETKPKGQLPSFISQADAGQKALITSLYQGAVDNYDAYGHVPCYCGCAVYTHAHKSLSGRRWVYDLHRPQYDLRPLPVSREDDRRGHRRQETSQGLARRHLQEAQVHRHLDRYPAGPVETE